MSAAASPSSERSLVEDASPGETERLAALRRYQILDTAQEPAFDRIVRLAALLLDVPIALISLVDADRQWFKARYGLDVPETPRAIAFCDHAIRGSSILVVPDAKLDPRFCDNPLVTGEMHVRFYAGAPLVTPDGFALGTICAIDRSPRDLNQRDAAILAALADQIVHELEVRSALGEMYREVAEGRHTTRTLQGEGAKLAALLNATDNAVVTTDTDGQVASLNRAAEAMFGLDPGESVGWPMSRLISTEQDLADGEALTRSSDDHGRRKNGVEFPIEVSRASWTDVQGRTASGAILRDMTERRRAEAEKGRQQAAEQTRDKLAALGRVAGGVAHELNNLLQPIIGLTQLELDSLPSEGTAEQIESRESLTAILDSGKQARDVVRKVLMFARKAKPELAAADFPAAVSRAIALFGKSLPSGVQVDEIIESGTAGLATINEAELAEVMANLADNAVYAMDGSGTLTIRVDRLELTDAASTLGIAAGGYFRIAVADTGHGMDAATRAQIFEPFFTTKPIGQGTGLGLSIVYGVLRDWKGAVAVDSSIGVGSTFSLYVPVTETT
jgi:PAS domain S-box-containing protein